MISNDKPQGKRNLEEKVLCRNCGKEGHLKPKCPELQKSNNDPKKTPESLKPENKVATTSVVEITSDDEGTWAAEEAMVDLEKDWFDEVVGELDDVKFKLIV